MAKPKPNFAKVRKKKTVSKSESLNAFAESAPVNDASDHNQTNNPLHELDRCAARNFNAIRLPVNEWELEAIKQAVAKSGQSRLGFIRSAVLAHVRQYLDVD